MTEREEDQKNHSRYFSVPLCGEKFTSEGVGAKYRLARDIILFQAQFERWSYKRSLHPILLSVPSSPEHRPYLNFANLRENCRISEVVCTASRTPGV